MVVESESTAVLVLDPVPRTLDLVRDDGCP